MLVGLNGYGWRCSAIAILCGTDRTYQVHAGGPVYRFRTLLLDQLRKRDTRQVINDGGIQVFPKIVRHATAVAEAIIAAFALARIDRLFYGENNIGNSQLIERSAKVVAAARPTYAFNQTATAQFAEQLFQVGERNFLPRADARKRDRTTLPVQSQIQHGGHCKTTFGGGRAA